MGPSNIPRSNASVSQTKISFIQVPSIELDKQGPNNDTLETVLDNVGPPLAPRVAQEEKRFLRSWKVIRTVGKANQSKFPQSRQRDLAGVGGWVGVGAGGEIDICACLIKPDAK